MDFNSVLKQLGYSESLKNYGARIEEWRGWYGGRVRDFHDYRIYNCGHHIKRRRASLNMAKQGAEFWAALLWNRDCWINLNDAEVDKRLQRILDANNFNANFNRLLEIAFALGTGALLAYKASDKQDDVRLEYIPAEMIFPLEYTNDEVSSCAFACRSVSAGRNTLYLMVHRREPNGAYSIANRYFEEGEDGGLVEIPTPENVLPSYSSPVKLFALVKPGISNNKAKVPMGLSIYANAIDVLKSIDLAYDGAKTSMEIGRPRIGVSSNMLVPDIHGGEPVARFDAQDIAVYDLGGLDEVKTSVQDLSTPYRATEFEESLKAQLRIYSQAIGLGADSFRWESGGAKTATEVIAENSAMLRAMVKHQDAIKPALVCITRAILSLISTNKTLDVVVAFDDSITRNHEQESLEAWQWVLSGKFPFWKYLSTYKGYDESEAKAIQAETESQSASYASLPVEE